MLRVRGGVEGRDTTGGVVGAVCWESVVRTWGRLGRRMTAGGGLNPLRRISQLPLEGTEMRVINFGDSAGEGRAGVSKAAKLVEVNGVLHIGELVVETNKLVYDRLK